jgi:hypothetical protein
VETASPQAVQRRLSGAPWKALGGQGIVVHNSSGGGRSVDDILMPGGNPIGVKGSGPRASARLREVTGGQAEAERIFQELTQGGKDVTPVGYPGTLIELPNGRGTVGYRPASKSGPPTIDVQVIDAAGQLIPVQKIKFVD